MRTSVHNCAFLYYFKSDYLKIVTDSGAIFRRFFCDAFYYITFLGALSIPFCKFIGIFFDFFIFFGNFRGYLEGI